VELVEAKAPVLLIPVTVVAGERVRASGITYTQASLAVPLTSQILVWGNSNIVGWKQESEQTVWLSRGSVSGNILVWGNTTISSDILVWGNTVVSDILVWGNILVWGDDAVDGDILVWGDSSRANILVWGNSSLSADILVWGD
jgi:hypothetical protein